MRHAMLYTNIYHMCHLHQKPSTQPDARHTHTHVTLIVIVTLTYLLNQKQRAIEWAIEGAILGAIEGVIEWVIEGSSDSSDSREGHRGVIEGS